MILTNLDEQFRGIEKLKWLPWVGKNYFSNLNNEKLLIVGESHYDEDSIQEALTKADFTRGFIKLWGVENPNGNQPVLRNTERALFGYEPFIDLKKKLWESVGYYNFIQRILFSLEASDRPIGEDYLIAWDTFFKVVEILKPQFCLFCGVASSDWIFYFNQACERNSFRTEGIHRLESKINSTYPRSATIFSTQDVKTKLIFMKHPSKYFIWEDWAEYINEQIGNYPQSIT